MSLVGTKKKGAPAALYMKQNLESSLAGVQLGMTLVWAVAAATGGAGAEESIAPYFQRASAFPQAWQESWQLPSWSPP